MQVPVLNGIYTDGSSDFRTSYPRNMIPVPKSTGIAQGYLRPVDGIIAQSTGPGVDRGGINWNGVCYRVMGSKLCSISPDGALAELGDVGGTTQLATLDYSFGRLVIASNNNLFYWSPSLGLVQVTDPDLGVCLDVLWVDGYFMTTDGTSLVVTELNNPLIINPLKYGSSEVDPDPVKGLLKLRNEVLALNRYTVESFDNIGGTGFPFARIDGAQLTRGVVGTHAACVFMERLAFVGSGRNESPAVWLGQNGQTVKLSTREIDQVLQEYTEGQLSQVLVEARVDKGHQHLWVTLPDKTLVYDGAATAVVGEPVWFIMTSGMVGEARYRAWNLVWCYDKWLCGDPTSTSYGYLTNTVMTQHGAEVDWEFGTQIAYNESRGAIFHEVELVCLTGRVAVGTSPKVWTSYSNDGVTDSVRRYINAGKQGQRNVRLLWLQQGSMNQWRTQKFGGTSDALLSIARLEIRVEPLNV
jgi:Phage stabilisation protein